MLLNLILGGAGSGKSKLSENKIEECINSGRKALVIVPERFSHIEEKTLIERFGGLGLDKIDVSTFSKLTRQIAVGKEKLLPSGKQMLIMKAVRDNKTAGDGIFEGSHIHIGFIDKMSGTIDELRKNMIEPETLLEYRGEGLIVKKLSAVGEIFKTYRELLGDKYQEPDENILKLSDLILEEGGFSDTEVFIDGFSDFMTVHYSVIESLIKMSYSVSVMLTLPQTVSSNPDSVFLPVLESAETLVSIAKNAGAEINKEILSGEYEYVNSPDIKFFLENYGEVNGKVAPEAENISVTMTPDRRSEIVHLASLIKKETRENGLRYRDIGVIVGDISKYSHIIEAVFSEYNIPYTVDNKVSALEHPVIRMALLAFRVIGNNFNYRSVFEYLKSGYIFEKTENGIQRISDDEVDMLEIYVKSRAIRGRNKWLSEDAWEYSSKGVFDEATSVRIKEEDITQIDNIRHKVMAPFINFYEKIKGRQKVSVFATALYEFLIDINLYQGLLIDKKEFEKKNMLDEAEMTESVWNVLLNTLDQAVMTSGDEYMSREDFLALLESGFSKESLDFVPQGIDRVSVGSADLSRPVLVKALFAVGAQKGEMPREGAGGGIITDSERSILSENGFNILKTSEQSKKLSEFNLFSSFTAATDRIYISYPKTGDEGEMSYPAEIISDIERMFGNVTHTLSSEDMLFDLLYSKVGTYNRMVTEMSCDISIERRNFWDEIWDSANVDYTHELEAEKADIGADLSVFSDLNSLDSGILKVIERYRNGKVRISPEIAGMLYKNRAYSSSRLQKYNECPFSFYLSYGLGLLEETEKQIGAGDIGTMIHWAVSEFCKEVQKDADTISEKKESWDKLTREKSDSILKKLLSDIEEKTAEANPSMVDTKLSLIMKKAEKTITRSVDTIKKSITNGSFAAVDFEKDFNFTLKGSENEIEIRGIIDRVDIAETDEGNLLRIIDYKTGKKEFSSADIYNKTDLQLVLYALAAEDMYKDTTSKIGAVMYNKVRDELQSADSDLLLGLKPAKLNGVVVVETEDTKSTDILYHDKNLSEGGASSEYLPLSVKKAGGLKKSDMIIDRKKYEALKKYVAKSALETDRFIKEGDITPYPLGADEYSPCTCCKFSSVCLFDKEKDKAREKITSKATAWELIEAEAENE